MNHYLITYDLRKAGQDYKALIAYLERVGAARVLKSTWVIKTSSSLDQVYNAVNSLVDGNDGILIVVVNGWYGRTLDAKIPA